MVECPVCGGEVELAQDAVVGELMECADCGSELEVTSLDPAAVGRRRSASSSRVCTIRTRELCPWTEEICEM